MFSRFLTGGRFNSDEQKESVRDLAALVRTAADATGRAAELLACWNDAADDDEEMRDLREDALDLLRVNATIARLTAEGHHGLALMQSQLLKRSCDRVASMRPIRGSELLAQERALIKALVDTPTWMLEWKCYPERFPRGVRGIFTAAMAEHKAWEERGKHWRGIGVSDVKEVANEIQEGRKKQELNPEAVKAASGAPEI